MAQMRNKRDLFIQRPYRHRPLYTYVDEILARICVSYIISMHDEDCRVVFKLVYEKIYHTSNLPKII